MQGIWCRMMWITGPEPPRKPQNPSAPKVLEDMLEDFVEHKESFATKAKVPEEQLMWLSNQTMGQRSSLLWGQYHTLRLTVTMLENLLGQWKEDRKRMYLLHYCSWKCCVHEKIALEEYAMKTGSSVQDCGLFLFPCGFLRRSPD